MPKAFFTHFLVLIKVLVETAQKKKKKAALGILKIIISYFHFVVILKQQSLKYCI